ncbi:MAG: response regulator [Psychromonas sp.]|nr:response regulator [Psychromonas sp.]
MNQNDAKALKVLIVDDCSVSALMMKGLLKQLFINDVDTTNSYKQAIAMCSHKAYNILLVDFHLEQDINGIELFGLLKKNSYISPSCSLITVSGDSTAQTVMGALATGYGSYLCKPVNKKNIEEKINLAFIHYKLFTVIYANIDKGDEKKALTLAVEFCKKNKSCNEVELFIINHLEKRKQFGALKYLTTHEAFQSRANFYCANIKNNFRSEQISAEDAISKLQLFIKKQTFFIPAYDLLSDIQEKNKQLKASLENAVKALEFTPAVPFRSLKVARLAAFTDEKQQFCKVGQTLAKNLSIAETDWPALISEFFVYFEKLLLKSETEDDKSKLLAFLTKFSEWCRNKFLDQQLLLFNVLNDIFQCRLMILRSKIFDAKYKFYDSFVVSFAKNLESDGAVLIEALDLCYFFSENKLFDLIYNELKSRKKIDKYSQCLLPLFDEPHKLIENMSLLGKELAKANDAFDAEKCVSEEDENNPELIKEREAAMRLYEAILQKHPLNTEACIGFLEHNLKLGNTEATPELIDCLTSIKPLKLSGDLEKRHDWIINTVSFEEKSDTSENEGEAGENELVSLDNDLLSIDKKWESLGGDDA